MSTQQAQIAGQSLRLKMAALAASPALIIFVATNLVNLGNLSFNLVFSRWMGPALFGDLTLLLTLKLAMLGMLGALQSAVSQRIAAADASDAQDESAKLAVLNRQLLFAGVAILPLIAIAMHAAGLGTLLGLDGNSLLIVLILGLPFSASLSMLRGIALGQLNAQKAVQSLVIEMLVRLVGGICVWFMGFGIAGVMVCVVASIVAGWVVLIDLVPWKSLPTADAQYRLDLGKAALPFGALYFAQVLALDGDIVLAKLALSPAESGLLAAILLFQRIQFFACFGLASVLLPSIVIALRTERALLHALLPVVALFSGTSLIILFAALWMPEVVVNLLVGPLYLAAADHILTAALAATCFTFSFLSATFLAAMGNKTGIWATLGVALVQLIAMAAFTNHSPASIQSLLDIKLISQALLAAFLAFVAARQILLQRKNEDT